MHDSATVSVRVRKRERDREVLFVPPPPPHTATHLDTHAITFTYFFAIFCARAHAQEPYGILIEVGKHEFYSNKLRLPSRK